MLWYRLIKELDYFERTACQTAGDRTCTLLKRCVLVQEDRTAIFSMLVIIDNVGHSSG
jgi:hypothetical protein